MVKTMGERKEFTSGSKNSLTIFIACSKTKRTYKTEAKNLYQGALFKKSLKYAQILSNTVFILSAKYGLLSLDEEIEPYEKSLMSMNKSEKLEWGVKVKNQMIKNKLKPPFMFLTGTVYNQFFEGEKPLTGLSLGNQLRWLNQKLNTNKTLFI
jgi:hypothetical protein